MWRGQRRNKREKKVGTQHKSLIVGKSFVLEFKLSFPSEFIIIIIIFFLEMYAEH